MDRSQLMQCWRSLREAYIALEELKLAVDSSWDKMSPREQLVCEKAIKDATSRIRSLTDEYRMKTRQFFARS